MKTLEDFFVSFRGFVQAVRTALSNRERWSELVLRLRRRLTSRREAPTTPQPVDTAHAVVRPEERPTPAVQAVSWLQRRAEAYLNGRNLQIVEYQSPEEDNRELRQRRHLARFMVEHCNILLPLIQRLRPTLQNGRSITWHLYRNDPDTLCVLTNFCSRLHQHFFLTDYQYRRAERQLKMRVRTHPFVQNFISGQWFEMGVAEMVRKWLCQRGYRHIVYQNLKLQCHGGAVLEVDLFIGVLVQDEFRWLMLECKSGIAISAEEANQVARASRLLNLFANRCAVVVPERVDPQQSELWAGSTGTTLMGIDQLGRFLREALR